MDEHQRLHGEAHGKPKHQPGRHPAAHSDGRKPATPVTKRHGVAAAARGRQRPRARGDSGERQDTAAGAGVAEHACECGLLIARSGRHGLGCPGHERGGGVTAQRGERPECGGLLRGDGVVRLKHRRRLRLLVLRLLPRRLPLLLWLLQLRLRARIPPQLQEAAHVLRQVLLQARALPARAALQRHECRRQRRRGARRARATAPARPRRQRRGVERAAPADGRARRRTGAAGAAAAPRAPAQRGWRSRSGLELAAAVAAAAAAAAPAAAVAGRRGKRGPRCAAHVRGERQPQVAGAGVARRAAWRRGPARGRARRQEGVDGGGLLEDGRVEARLKGPERPRHGRARARLRGLRGAAGRARARTAARAVAGAGVSGPSANASGVASRPAGGRRGHGAERGGGRRA